MHCATFFFNIQLYFGGCAKCHKEADVYKVKLGWLLFDKNQLTLFPLNSFMQINTEGSIGTLRPPACVSSCAVLVCTGWNLHLTRAKSEIFIPEINNQLNQFTSPHLYCGDTGSGAEAWIAPAPVFCCVVLRSLEVCQDHSEVSCCVSAWRDSQACRVQRLYMVYCLRQRPGPRTYPGWSPRSRGCLQRETRCFHWGSSHLNPLVVELPHLLDSLLCCLASWVQMCCFWQTLVHPDGLKWWSH